MEEDDTKSKLVGHLAIGEIELVSATESVEQLMKHVEKISENKVLMEYLNKNPKVTPSYAR